MKCVSLLPTYSKGNCFSIIVGGCILLRMYEAETCSEKTCIIYTRKKLVANEAIVFYCVLFVLAYFYILT
jgi:hypothetical protein